MLCDSLDCQEGCSCPGPGPGSLQAFGLQFTRSRSAHHFPVMDVLVTTGIRRGVVLGFRFFKRDEDYLSPKSTSVTFTLTECVLPGAVLRLNDCGRSLVMRRDECVWKPVAARASVPVAVPSQPCCFIFWLPRAREVSGISFIGFSEKARPTLPPPVHVIPCEFSTLIDAPCTDFTAACVSDSDSEDDTSLCTDDADDAPSAAGQSCNPFYMVFNGPCRGIASSWIRAWQHFKYTHVNKWACCSLYRYENLVQEIANTLYVCPVPGQLIPLAFRPCEGDEAGETAFPAQLVALVTAPLPPATRVWLVPNCSNVENVRAEALWQWVSPSKLWVPAGVSVVFSGLAAHHHPRASVGHITRSGSWPSHSFSISAITLYGMGLITPGTRSPDCHADAHAITGVYTCGSRAGLPPGLVLGESVPATLWPCSSSIVPMDSCTGRIPRDWLCEKLKLLKTKPVRWVCQPIPVFKRAHGHHQNQEGTSPIVGPMSGAC